MFSGEYEVSMDDKGRTFIPVKCRDELGTNVVMWRGTEGQIMIYPTEVWQKIAEKLDQQVTRQRVRQAKWILFSGTGAEVDRQGRVVIPAPLRKYAQLGNELVMVGISDHLEIWNQNRWEALTNRLMNEGGDIADQLADLGVRF